MIEVTTIRYRELLRHRDFSRLWVAQIVSLFGDAVTGVALGLLVYELTHSPSALALVFAVRVIPFIAIIPFSGVVADQMYRKSLLIGADLIRAGLIALMPFVSQVWQVYVLIFAHATLGTVFEPAYEATLPEVVGQARYAKAVSLASMSFWIGEITGPAIAAALIVSLGLRPMFWIDAATFVISAALISQTYIPRQTHTKMHFSLREFLTDIRVGFAFIVGRPTLRLVAYLSIITATAGAVILVNTVVYVEENLGQPESMFGAVMSILAAGSVTGVLLAGRLAQPGQRAWLMILGAVGQGIFLATVSFAPGLWPFAGLYFLAGLGSNLYLMPRQIYLAELTPNDVRGRVFAVMMAVTHMAWLILYLTVGRLSDALGVKVVFALAGGVVVIGTGVAVFTSDFRALLAHDRSAPTP